MLIADFLITEYQELLNCFRLILYTRGLTLRKAMKSTANVDTYIVCKLYIPPDFMSQ